MDQRVRLLKRFFSDMQADRLKLETKSHGFGFLSRILEGGCSLEYGQLTHGMIHKYKLLDVPGDRLDEFLAGHVEGGYNVCRYFQEGANQVCCFNLDNNFKEYDYDGHREPIPEESRALDALAGSLRDLGLEPLVLISGRGHHLWLRYEEPIPTPRLYDFMIRTAARTLATLHEAGHDYRRIKISPYPNPQIIHTGSLRMFGSRHVQSGAFSHVLLDGRKLDESGSWDYCAHYLDERTVPVHRFDRAVEEIRRFYGRDSQGSAD